MQDERRVGSRRRKDYIWHRRWNIGRLVAWVAIIAATSWGFHLSHLAIDKVDRETQARIYTTCLESNEARNGIQDFVLKIIRNGHPTGPLTENEQHIIDLAATQFHPLSCPPPPTGLKGK